MPVHEDTVVDVVASSPEGPTVVMTADPVGLRSNTQAMAGGLALALFGLIVAPEVGSLPPGLIRIGSLLLVGLLAVNLLRMGLILWAPLPTITIGPDAIIEQSGGVTVTIDWDDVAEINNEPMFTIRLVGIKCRTPNGVRVTGRNALLLHRGWKFGNDWVAGEASLPVGGDRLAALLRTYRANRASGASPLLATGTLRVDDLLDELGSDDRA